MSATLRIARVTQLPAAPSRNTLYLVDTANPTVFDIWLSSPNGQILERTFSSQDAAELIETLKNIPLGLVGLDAQGLIPSNLLPSFVDDVIEYPTFESLPLIGNPGKIYVSVDTNQIYRWSGSQYIEISSLSGTADSALKLKTARTINGVPFDGTSGIVINAVDSTERIASSEKGIPGGVAVLGSNGKLVVTQLPDSVKDVYTYNSSVSFPATGEPEKIYINRNTGLAFYWTGTAYATLSPSPVASVAGKTGAVTLARADVGLGNVDNTSDNNKPVSVAQQAAITTAQNAAIAASAPKDHVGSGGGSHDVARLNSDTGMYISGFLSGTDKAKLDGILGTNTGDETGATIRSKLGVTTLTGSNTGDETAATIRSKLGVTTLSGSNTGDQTNVTGNAGTATKLLAARTINGVSFDGSANITVNAVDSTARIAATEKGAPNGVATLDGTGKIPAGQLPAFVDDVQEFASLAAFPVNGATGSIYIAIDTNRSYRWSGSTYTMIVSGNVDSVAGKTGVVTLVKGDVGLSNVDNTSDANKPVSSAQQAAISVAENNAKAASTPLEHVGAGGAAHALVTTAVEGFMSPLDKIKLNAISGTNTGDETVDTIKAKLGVAVLSGANTGDQVNIPGNAATATALQTSRTINGVAFDGTQDIVINAVDLTPRIAASEKGTANGVATLDSTGKLTSSQLPSFVDDILEYADLTTFPSTGESGKLYVSLDTNRTYRWGGSSYTQITSGAVDSVAGKTGVVTLVKGDVGLSLVDNTDDMSKPVSNPQANALGALFTQIIASTAPASHVGSVGNAHNIADTQNNGFMSSADKVKLNAITGTNTGDETAAGIRTKLGVTTLSGSNTGDQTNIPGNAATATVLQTARTINGVSFNGSANITINAVDSTSRIAASEKGAANGVATLDSTGKVPSAQLPSFVDDVLEFANLAAFPSTGISGAMYVAIDTNKVYRWSGTQYIFITSGAVDSVAGKTGVVTLVKGDVGLGNVDNTADANKPVSTAQQTAITQAENNAKAASTPLAHVGSGGAAHAVATSTVNGFMSTSDKSKLDAISGTNTGDETGASIRSKLGVTTLTGSNTGDQISVTGNAGTATALQNPRTINGVAFDGTADITINAVDGTPRIATALLGANNGVATLDGNGKVPTTQLPSFVDDILEFTTLTAFPTTGETGKIYVALDTNKTYRWSGTTYVFITSGAVDSVAGKTGVITLVKADVGLNNVDNTADSAKPVSGPQQSALDTKISISEKAAINGVATLDQTGKLVYAQLPIRTLIGLVPALSGTATIPWDNNGAPLVTEGAEIVTQGLSPSDPNGKLHISGTILLDCNTANRNFVLACFKGNVCIGTLGLNFITVGRPQLFPFDFYDPDFGSLIGTSANYSLRLGANAAATWYVNRMATQVLNGTMNLNRPVRFEELN